MCSTVPEPDGPGPGPTVGSGQGWFPETQGKLGKAPFSYQQRKTLCFGNKHHHPSSGGLDAYTHSFLLSSAVSVQADELTLLSFPCISCRDEFCRSNKY